MIEETEMNMIRDLIQIGNECAQEIDCTLKLVKMHKGAAHITLKSKDDYPDDWATRAKLEYIGKKRFGTETHHMFKLTLKDTESDPIIFNGIPNSLFSLLYV